MTVEELTPVQRAVLGGCAAHQRSSFMSISPDCWFRAGRPFRGDKRGFASHLRALERKGLLSRRSGRHARYRMTLEGERLAEQLKKMGAAGPLPPRPGSLAAS